MTRPPEITPLPWDLLTRGEGLNGIESMLELGNKKSPGQKPYKVAFQRMGIRHVSVDLNGQDGALELDLREPLKLGRFDMVTNFGTSEHVSEQEPVWRNIIEATGKVLISMTPIRGWSNHGIWYPTQEFYHQLAELNDFHIEFIENHTWKPRGTLCCVRMHRHGEVPFAMPDQRLITRVAASDPYTKSYG